MFYNNNNKIIDINSFIEILESNVHTINKDVISIFKHAVLLFNEIYNKNIYIHSVIEDSDVIQDFVKKCSSDDSTFNPMFIDIISVLINNNTQKLGVIMYGLVKDCLSINDTILQKIIIRLVRDNPNNILNLIDVFIRCCLLLNENNYQIIQETIFGLLRDNSNNAFNILYAFAQNRLLQRNIYGVMISENFIIKLIQKNPNNILDIVLGFIQGYLSKGKKCLDNFITFEDLIMNYSSINKFDHFMFQRFVIKLIQLNPNNILDIVLNLIQNYLLKYKDISNLESFFIEASIREDIGIDIIYNFICACVLNKECQLDSENMKYLINFVKYENNKIAYESKIILCGIYVSDYLLKSHNKEINKNLQLSEEFTNLLSEVLDRKIQKIEDLTIGEIKLLFDKFMNIKFNQTQKGINGSLLNIGPFLQIIISLAENSGIEDNTTIKRLFNRNSQENIKINDYQDKLNDFGYVEIANDAKIDSIKTFLEILKLKESDFGKNGFKTFHVNFPRHGAAIVIDTSKSYDKFIENNKDIIKDIIL